MEARQQVTNIGSAKFILTKVHRSSVAISVFEQDHVTQSRSIRLRRVVGGHPGLSAH